MVITEYKVENLVQKLIVQRCDLLMYVFLSITKGEILSIFAKMLCMWGEYMQFLLVNKNKNFGKTYVPFIYQNYYFMNESF